MENNDLHKLWKKTDQLDNNLDKNQLKSMIMKKNKRIFLEFTVFYIVSMVISAGAMVYLIISALKRSNDGYFLCMNGLLFVFSLVAFMSSFFAIKTVKPEMPADSNLQEFIVQKVSSLEKSCMQVKYQNPLLLLLTILFALSIQVFFANKPLQEIMSTSQSAWGFVFGMVVSVPLGMFLSRKIMKHYTMKMKQLKTNLEELENT